MHSIKRNMNSSGLLLVLVLGAIVTYKAIGQGRGAAMPSRVATVNLGLVLEGLEQRASAETDLEQMKAKIRAEDEQWTANLQDLKAQLDEMPAANAPARSALEEKTALLALEYQEWRRFKAERVDLEKSLLWRDLFISVQNGARELCEIEGYDIVMVDDSQQELMVNPEAQISREGQVTQQMTSRRILYAGSAIDITDELIKRMNNEFAAGG